MRRTPQKKPVKIEQAKEDRACRERCVVKRASPETFARCRRVGRERHNTDRARGVYDNLKSTSVTAIQCDVMGVLGEWAAATYCAVAWNEDTSKKDEGWDFILPDGRKVDVKSARQIGYRLLIPREKSLDADVYVLAYAHAEKPTVYLAGWCTRDEFEAGYHTAPEMRNRPRAMWPKQLHRMETL